MKFKFLAATFFASVFVTSLSGCGTVTSKAASGQAKDNVSDVVAMRAQQRWNALLKQDMNAAYEYISPGGRSLMTVEQYRPRVNTAFWRGAKVEKATCEAETCEVAVLVDLIFQGVKFTNPVQETWILDAGKWWFVYKG